MAQAQGTNTEAWGSVCLLGQTVCHEVASSAPSHGSEPIRHRDSRGLAGTHWDSTVGPGAQEGDGTRGDCRGLQGGADSLWGRWGTQGSFQNWVLAEEMPAMEKELICSL